VQQRNDDRTDDEDGDDDRADNRAAPAWTEASPARSLPG
jgi:hypothetical protein